LRQFPKQTITTITNNPRQFQNQKITENKRQFQNQKILQNPHQFQNIVGEGQTEENHSGKGETRIGGGSFGVFPGLWTMACD
jgi:hypothetical protein